MDNLDLIDPVDDIFDEEYEDNQDSDEDIALAEEDAEAVEASLGISKDEAKARLGISKAQAESNYSAAGTEVEEESDRITVDGNKHMMSIEVDDILDIVVEKLEMPYKPAEFQRVAINVLGQQKHLILASPTGLGKMNVPLLATLVLREKLKKPKGVAIVTQPLTSIMNQKMTNDVCDVAVLSMAGELRTRTDNDDDEDDASLSCNLQELLDGRYPTLLGHPESFDSKLGQHILRELQRLDSLILVCIDEFHQGGESHWSSFRPSMMKGSTGLRLYGVKDCPTLAMTATATKEEIDEVVTAMGLRVLPVILTSDPIQPHIKYSVVRRPSNNFGLDGTTNKNGDRKPGLMDLLQLVFLQKYFEDLEKGRKPMSAIVFCRGNAVMGAIYSRLMELTNYRYKDARDSPFVMNHSSLLPPTEKVLATRASEISLYLTSNKMLLGIDLADIDMVIFLRPFNQPASLVQGGGRGGRKMENGKRRRVQVYQFFNSQDLTSRNKLMSPQMKKICLSKECSRLLLKEFFVGNSEQQEVDDVLDDGHCCHNCDQQKL